MKVKENRIPETAQEAIVRLETALEHASHAWNALEKSGQVPDRPRLKDAWPPRLDWTLQDVESVAYHLSALIQGTYEVYQGMLNSSEADELRDLDEGYGDAPEG